MTGLQFQIEVEYGLETKKIMATVEEYLGNNQYVLLGDNGQRYIRTLRWVK